MKEVIMHLDELIKERDEYAITDLQLSEEELCRRYEKLYTGPVSDVLRENLKLDQVLSPEIKPLRDNMKVAGVAFTIKSIKDSTIGNEMETRGKMLDSITKNSVCVWFTGGDNKSAHWGEVMTMAAKARGCKGAVVDGGLRDIEQVLAQEFPVFYKYRTPNGSLARCKMIGYQVPITINDVIIRPGDIIFGDISGVVVIPRNMAYKVLLRAEEIVHREHEIKSWIRNGVQSTEIVERGGYF
jgi:4-hydroxy-4-methyl-2-oxoglutarate aldolase